MSLSSVSLDPFRIELPKVRISVLRSSYNTFKKVSFILVLSIVYYMVSLNIKLIRVLYDQ